MATVTMLKRAVTTRGVVDQAATEIGAAAAAMTGALERFDNGVKLPVGAGTDWSGVGQPNASGVVNTNSILMGLARGKLTKAQQTFSSFAGWLGQIARDWQQLQVQLDPARYDVAEDGTVTPKAGAVCKQGDVSPQALTTAVKQLLGHLDMADIAFGAALGGNTAGTLPVPSANLTNQFDAAVTHAMDQADADVTGPQPWNQAWSPMGNMQPGARAAWLAALGPAAAMYRGGGFMKGPDGRLYPIATPAASFDGTTYTHGDGVGALDPGWRTLGVNTGITGYGDEATGLEKAAIIAGGAAGGTGLMKSIDSVSPQGNRGLVLDQNGYPIAVNANPAQVYGKPPGDRPLEPGEIGYGSRKDISGPVAITNGTLEGIDKANHMDDGNDYAYRAEFQENADGRTRVVYNTYQVHTDQVYAGPPRTSVQPYDTYVGDDGRVHMDKARYHDEEPAPGQTEVGPAHQVKVRGQN